ncbi:MAG: hypothetical protein R3E53_01480 [Myxococcota bacterium]
MRIGSRWSGACDVAALLVLALVGSLGCAPIWSPTAKGPGPHPLASIQITASGLDDWGWASYEALGGVWHFTRQGDELNQVWMRRWPKSQVVKGTNRSIRDDMTLQEIAALSLDSRRLDDGVARLEVVSNEPARVGNRDCYRIDYRHRNDIGLLKRTVEYGCPVGTWMYRFEYMAPAQYYFDAYLREFEAFVRSVAFKVPGA